jgi:hypothetical protein
MLLTLAFIIAVMANSLGAVSPHIEGEGGCSAACCHQAHQRDSESNASKLCCKLECSQPGGTHAASTTTFTVPAADKNFSGSANTGAHLAYILFRRLSFPKSPTRNIAGSSERYLETGTLLI